MKESFRELYSRLYRENFSELEEERKRENRITTTILAITVATFVFFLIFPNYAFFSVIFAFIVVLILIIIKANIKKEKIKNGEKTYTQIFKDKIIKPLIENNFENSSFFPERGMTKEEYREASFKESFDRYNSDDMVVSSTLLDDYKKIEMVFSEVHTHKRYVDSKGRSTYVTMFHGLVSKFHLPKNINSEVYLRSNYRVSGFNKNKVSMDMSEFEKIFDIEAENKILAMRLLTPDIMSELVEIYNKYKYKFEINIKKDTVYMRINSGTMFEPKFFGNTLEYKYIERFYLVLKMLTDISKHIYQVVDEVEI